MQSQDPRKVQQLTDEAMLYAPEAECWYLALLVRHPDLILEGCRRVPPEWLFCSNNKYVYNIMLFIYKNSRMNGWTLSFDCMSMLLVARSLGQYYEKEFLLKTEGMKTIRNIEEYAQHTDRNSFDQLVGTIEDRARRVDIFRKSMEVINSVKNLSKCPDSRQAASLASADFSEIAFKGSSVNTGRIVRLGSVEEEYTLKCRLNAAYPGANLISLYLNHLPCLMGVLGGIQRKGVTVCTARGKTGKTTFAGAMALQASVIQNVPTLYMDTEVDAGMIYSRSMSNLTRLDEGQMLRGKFYKEGVFDPRINDAIAALRQANFYYINISRMRPDEVSSVIRDFRSRHVGASKYIDPADNSEHILSNPGLVIYDWLKLADASEMKNGSEHQLLGYLMSSLQDAARDNDLPIFALGQNNRSAVDAKKSTDWEDKAETFVGGSDRISHFCTALMTLRNLNRLENKCLARDGEPRPGIEQLTAAGDINTNSLQFNQVMHLIYNRFGVEKRSGIPLYLNRGTSWYQEMGDEKSMELLTAMKTKVKEEKNITPPATANGQIIQEKSKGADAF